MKLSVALQAVTDRKQDVCKLFLQRLQTRVDEFIRCSQSSRLNVSLLVIASPTVTIVLQCVDLSGLFRTEP